MTQRRLLDLIITVGGVFLNAFNNFPFLQRCLSSLEHCYIVFCQFSELFWWISVTQLHYEFCMASRDSFRDTPALAIEQVFKNTCKILTSFIWNTCGQENSHFVQSCAERQPFISFNCLSIDVSPFLEKVM